MSATIIATAARSRRQSTDCRPPPGTEAPPVGGSLPQRCTGQHSQLHARRDALQMRAGSCRVYEPQHSVTVCLATELAARRTVIGGPARDVHWAEGRLVDVVGEWA